LGIVVFALNFLSVVVYAQSGTGTLRGTVTDPSGAAVLGATITVTSSSGEAKTASSNAEGAYEIRGLPVGVYHVKIAAPGFQDFDKDDVVVSTGQVQTLDAPLSIQVEQQHVQVSDTAPTLEVSPEKNASAINLKGTDLDALSEDPDQLQQDLQALAGPATGPNGGQMYVNGFTAGQLPPKSSIREIKVNQNPFSAEYDAVGFGRIEILTKPGANQLHGDYYAWANDQPFNSWSPFVAPNDRPGYYTFLDGGDLSGSLNKKTSFSLEATRRDVHNISLGAQALDQNAISVSPGAQAVENPHSRSVLGGSVDYQLSRNNTLTVFYQYWKNTDRNDGISSFTLPSQGYNNSSYEHQLQISDTHIFHDTIVNEARFQYLRDYTANTPVSNAVAFSAPAYVTGGGNSMGPTVDRQNHFELQNYTTIVKGKNTIEFGARLRDATDWNSSLTIANGSFTFASSAAYIAAQTAASQGNPVPPADYPEAFASGVGSPIASVNLFDAGLFLQDDWQWRPNITLSGGLRFETQTGMPDHTDFAPRAAIAYGIGKTKTGAPRSVLRAGWGIFYDRFPESNLLNTYRFNGVNQVTYTISNPDFYPNVPTNLAGVATSSLPTVDTISPSLHAPYTMQTAVTLEQQLFHGSTLTVNYIDARSVHQFYTANINTPLPGTFDPTVPTSGTYPFGYGAGYIDQYESGGIYKQDELIVNFDGKIGKALSVYSYYVLNNAHGTTGSLLSSYYQPSLDYGRSTFDIRDRVFVGGSVTLRYGLEASLFQIYTSGQPFNITSGTNLYGTSATSQNSRPSFTTLPLTTPGVFATPWGNVFNGLPAPGETVIPINLGTGPSQFYTNLGVSKTFHFGPKPETQASNDNSASSSSNASAAPPVGRYTLEFSVYSRNVFNRVSYGLPVGVIGSPNFLQPVSLAFNGPANRQIFLYARFAF
jgi:hypothetical protein